MYHTPYWGNGKGELFSFMLTVVILRKYLFQNNFLYALKSSVDWLYFLKIINIQRSKNWLTAREIYRFMTSDICCSKCTNRFNFFLVFFHCWYNYCLLRTPYKLDALPTLQLRWRRDSLRGPTVRQQKYLIITKLIT